MSTPAPVKKKTIFNNVFFVGVMTFFGGISQDIFAPILPLYLANVLHLDKEFIGLTSGLVTSVVSIFRIIAGYITDRYGRTKPIIFAGYFLSLVSRPFLAIVTSNIGILALRGLDGIGKGVKDSPKDALVADSTEVGNRGKGFGIARALDTFGSVVGPLVLFLLLGVFANDDKKYEYIFLIAGLPLIITLLVLVFKVKEPPVLTKKQKAAEVSKPLPKKFYIFLAIVILFNLGNSADAFLILRAQNLGVALLAIPLVYALFNFVYASASIPLGSLSDRIGREQVIMIGWTSFAVAYLGFGIANETWQVWLLFAFYGIYFATTEGVAKALIADLVTVDHRGRAYGLYNALIAIIALPASVIAGFLWDRVSPAMPFYFGALIAGIAAILLFWFLKVYNRPQALAKLA